MKRLVIAIDCDDVLVNATEYVVRTYNETYNTSVRIEHAHQSTNSEWGVKQSEVFKRLDDIQHTREYGLIVPRDVTIKVVTQLAQNHELHLVSARGQAILDVTHTMLERYFADCFQGVEHVGIEKTKGQVCTEIGAHIMIDDNIHNLLSAQAAGVQKLIWFGRYPWQNNEDWVEGIDRCADWTEVRREIDEFAR